MSVKLIYGGESTITKFPQGESLVKVALNDSIFHVELIFESNNDLFDLALMANAIRQDNIDPNIHLVMKYLPYARQDRVCNEGESLSVKVVADFINSLNFKTVECWDLHSDVSIALINNLTHLDLEACFEWHMIGQGVQNMILVSPDIGAYKKVFKLNKNLFCGRPLCVGHKVRDTKTGNLSNTTVDIPEEIEDNTHFLIVDDILDNGGTFIPLANAIKAKVKDAKVSLYVTHGLFNSGVDKFAGVFEKIYVANLMMKPEFTDTFGLIA